MNETSPSYWSRSSSARSSASGPRRGVARMFHAPKVQGMGAFRTLGELNACENDPVAHFSFGFGFFFNAWASAVGTGALTATWTTASCRTGPPRCR